MRRWLFRISAALVAVGLVVLAVRSYLPQATLVDTAPVRREAFLSTIEHTARARVRDRHTVAAPVSGSLVRIALRAGDRVAAGAAVAEILPPGAGPLDPRAQADARARMEAAADAQRQARAQVQAVGEALAQARRELQRAQALEQGGSATRQQREAAELEVARGERELAAARYAAQAAEHQVESARALLQPPGGSPGGRAQVVMVPSPVEGTVLRVLQPSAGPVAAGTPLLEVGDLRSMEVVAEVQTQDAVALRAGMRVVFEQWGGPRPLSGKVRVVEPSAFTRVSPLGVEEQRVNVVMDLTDPPEQWRGLGDGYELQARFVVWEGDGVLQAPASALFRRGEGWAAFVVASGKAQERPVGVGHRSPSDAEISQGLAEGEQVVLHPGETLRAGMAVRPR